MIPSDKQLSLDNLPDLPQTATLKNVAPNIWANEEVIALWVGGSLAAGRADRYSDVDLFLAVNDSALAQWRAPDLDTIFRKAILARQYFYFDHDFFVHHLILANSLIFDIHVQAVGRSLTETSRLILGCRDVELRAKLEKAVGRQKPIAGISAEAPTIQTIIETYWLHTHKHPKVLFRNLELVVWVGLRRMQAILLRLYYILASGEDCGDLERTTIHGMTSITQVLREAFGAGVLEVVGRPLRSKAEITVAIDRLNDEVGRVGRLLAEKYEFSYPTKLEAMVLDHWSTYRSP